MTTTDTTETTDYYLSRGSHNTPEEGLCAMELVALLAGEPHTDCPVCVNDTLITFCQILNDVATDEDRQTMIPVLPRTIGIWITKEQQKEIETWTHEHTSCFGFTGFGLNNKGKHHRRMRPGHDWSDGLRLLERVTTGYDVRWLRRGPRVTR
jgi:hypothetical protein